MERLTHAESYCVYAGEQSNAEALMQRFELGWWGMILGAGIAAKYVGEVELPYFTLPMCLSVYAGAYLGAWLGASMGPAPYANSNHSSV